MNSLFDFLERVSQDLADSQVEWALVGGLAVGARCEPRFTRDLDIAVAVAGDYEAEGLIRNLCGRGYQVNAVLEQASTGRLATVRLLPSFDGRLVDFLFASSGIESEVVRQAELVELTDRLRTPVATVGHLIAMKVLARDDGERPQDRVDLSALFRKATPGELARAREALTNIELNGYARGRDLTGEFQGALAEFQ